MKKKLIKLSIIVIVSIPCIFFTHVEAHNQSQAGILNYYAPNNSSIEIGSENIGWIIEEKVHQASHNINYRFSSSNSHSLTNGEKTLFRAAVQQWKNCGASITERSSSDSSSGMVCVYEEPSEPLTAAVFTEWSTDTNGHCSEWKIKINHSYSYNLSSRILSHEIGHAYGLRHLKRDENSNKLMYDQIQGWSAYGPTIQDIKGFRVITGLHNNHSWKYTPYGSATHTKKCTICDGEKTENCTFVNNYCSKCGRQKN